ncbi:MAG TPA: hypothetical protein VK046_03000 [Actinomycetaceae bacterium]|nr:hypothetical protein [Actinomycetaceae bacterium]
MNLEQPWILDMPLGDSGFTARHAIVAALLLVMVVTVLSTLWNGRGSRRTCGAPTRGRGRCRRPLVGASRDCGIHTGAWVARDVTLGALVGVVGSLLFWNFEAVLAGIGSFVSNTIA